KVASYDGKGEDWSPIVKICATSLACAVGILIVRFLAKFIGEENANKIMDSLFDHFMGEESKGKNDRMLGDDEEEGGPVIGGAPLPKKEESPFGGFDIPKLLAGFGSWLSAPPTKKTDDKDNDRPKRPTTPKYRPMYED